MLDITFSAELPKVESERSRRLAARLKNLDDKFREFVRYVSLRLASECDRHSTCAALLFVTYETERKHPDKAPSSSDCESRAFMERHGFLIVPMHDAGIFRRVVCVGHAG